MVIASRLRRWLLAPLVALALALGLYVAAGYLDSDPAEMFGIRKAHPPYAAVLFSGDMGLRLGMSSYIADALNHAGIPVLGLSSATEFARRKSRAEVDALVARSIEAAAARTGATRIILIGQSYGADIARVGLAHLPAGQRPRLAAAVFIVPGRTAYFRADPTGLSYRGAPDAGPAEAAVLDWLPLLCIKGADETDSLCPLLTSANVRRVVLPGGHLLARDHRLLTRTILAALAPVIARGAR